MINVKVPVKNQTPEPPALTTGHEGRVATLNGADRCDACASGAERAYVGITINGTEILLCAHHYAAHELALMPYMSDPANVRDERWQLTDGETDRKRTGVSA
jgi:hypothetical protein